MSACLSAGIFFAEFPENPIWHENILWKMETPDPVCARLFIIQHKWSHYDTFILYIHHTMPCLLSRKHWQSVMSDREEEAAANHQEETLLWTGLFSSLQNVFEGAQTHPSQDAIWDGHLPRPQKQWASEE